MQLEIEISISVTKAILAYKVQEPIDQLRQKAKNKSLLLKAGTIRRHGLTKKAKRIRS